MYVMLGTRPDLTYAVGKLARFSVNPSPDHFSAVLRTFGYLKNTADARLVYRRVNVSSPGPHGYTDADFAGDHTDAKSTSGYVFFLGDTAFSWSSKKQEAVSTSTMEAEYIALYFSVQQAVWIHSFLDQIGFPLDNLLPIRCDNQAAIAVVNGNELPHKRVKHMNVKYHFSRGCVQANKVSVTYVASKLNLADQFTKSLPRDHFAEQVDALGFEFEN